MSKTNQINKYIAANAITVLNQFHYNFSGLDLKNIKIPGAILDNVILDQTNLEKANLRAVSLKNSYINKVNLNQTNLKNI
jgi:uncharacterized protein YjbI with pentapeptide repeats